MERFHLAEKSGVSSLRIAVCLGLALALSACGKSAAPEAPQTSDTAAQGQDMGASAADAATNAAAESTSAANERAAADLAAKESALAEREAALAAKEQEADLARREVALAAEKKAARRAPQVAAAKPVKQTARVADPAPPPAPVAPLVVARGTSLSIELVNAVSSKTATVGDRVDGRLAADVIVDGRTALAAGTPVQGSVTHVISGSKTIGGTPTLGIVFDQLDVGRGPPLTFNANLEQVGKSDKGRDAAKIAGGAVAGAVIGHQIDHDDKGKIIGGILGGAAGALAAKKTGGDVSLAAGTLVSVELTSPLEIKRK